MQGVCRLSKNVFLRPTNQMAAIQLRNRHNINPMRPKMPTWKRKVMLEFGAPRFTEKHETTENLWQDCPRVAEVEKESKMLKANAYEAIYARELADHLESSKVVGIFHSNFLSSRGERKAWQNARRLKLQMENYEAVMVRSAVEGTQWENLLFFLEGGHTHQRLVFSKELSVANLVKLEKKVPEIFLIGAFVENRMLDRAGIVAMSKMPTIDVLLAETLAILNSPAQKTHQLLSSNQQLLSTNLSQYVKDKSGE